MDSAQEIPRKQSWWRVWETQSKKSWLLLRGAPSIEAMYTFFWAFFNVKSLEMRSNQSQEPPNIMVFLGKS